MERIIYRKTLDVHKNGVQFVLQGFETADNMSRKVEISLMASGDAIDFPLEQIMAVMYVNAPGTDETSVVECVIKDNTVVYDVLPIMEEGIAELQLKLIDTRPEGARAVLAAPKFAIEVAKSSTNEETATQTAAFTALEEAVAKAKAVYDARFLRMEIDSNGVFRAYYADGTVFENDSINRLLFKGDAVLAKSYAKGGTGVRTDEEIDNARYYSNVCKSAVTEVQDGFDDAKAVLDEVQLHGVYTIFSVDFETGEVVYISPKYKFNVNDENGDLEVDGKAYALEKEIRAFVDEYLLERSFDIENIIETINENQKEILLLNEEVDKKVDKDVFETQSNDMIGMILWFAGTTAPTHFLVCDGSAVSKADYTELYNVIGGVFGEETETHFYLPDLRGKFIRGTGSNLSNFAETQLATSFYVRGNLGARDCDSITTISGSNSGGASSVGSTTVYSIRPYNITLTPIIRY